MLEYKLQSSSSQQAYRDCSRSPSEAIRNFLKAFKVQQCPIIESSHSLETCNYYHSAEDQRRDPYLKHTFAYWPQHFCNCVSPNCFFVHNPYEKMYHPLTFKTMSCANYSNCISPNCPHLHEQDALLFQKHGQFFGFDLNSFKTQPCPFREAHHERQICLYYHSDADKRRRNFEGYSHVLCDQKRCNDPQCRYSLNKIEQLYHPSRYKSKFCKTYQSSSEKGSVYKCPYREFCSFAHSCSEIVIEILHLEERTDDFYVVKFKTVWCPFTQDHNRTLCPYAHNYQDYRRNPLEFKYQFERCSYWDFVHQIKSIEESGCPYGLECDRSHGWVEKKYHPSYFKCNSLKTKNTPPIDIDMIELKLQSCNKNTFSKKHHEPKQRLENKVNASDKNYKSSLTTVGAPFFKLKQTYGKERSISSRKTEAKSINISSSSNEGSRQALTEPIAMPFLMEEDKVWEEGRQDRRMGVQSETDRVRHRSEGKQGSEIVYTEEIKGMLQEIGIEDKLRKNRINEVKLINLDEKEINRLKYLDVEQKQALRQRLNEYVGQTDLREIEYSGNLTRFFLSRKCRGILDKMRGKKVREERLLNLASYEIQQMSFLSLSERGALPQVLRAYGNEKQFSEISRLINSNSKE